MRVQVRGTCPGDIGRRSAGTAAGEVRGTCPATSAGTAAVQVRGTCPAAFPGSRATTSASATRRTTAAARERCPSNRPSSSPPHAESQRRAVPRRPRQPAIGDQFCTFTGSNPSWPPGACRPSARSAVRPSAPSASPPRLLRGRHLPASVPPLALLAPLAPLAPRDWSTCRDTAAVPPLLEARRSLLGRGVRFPPAGTSAALGIHITSCARATSIATLAVIVGRSIRSGLSTATITG
jgi:hypothetical protein